MPGRGRSRSCRRRRRRRDLADDRLRGWLVDRARCRTPSATNVMPMNRTASRMAIDGQRRRGVARLRRLERRHAVGDRLGAGQRDRARGEGPQISSRMPTPAAGRLRPGSGSGRRLALADARRPGTTPIAIISSAETTNTYVGIAKMLPDSRRPRRLPSMIRMMARDADDETASRQAGNCRDDLLDGRRGRDGDRHARSRRAARRRRTSAKIRQVAPAPRRSRRRRDG